MEFVILGFFAVGYLILAGADIGIGMLLPYLGRTPAERREVIAAIAPFFLGNEVWLVSTAGVLAGLFPHVEGTLMGGPNFLAVVGLVTAWIVRDMGLWLRGRLPGARWQAFWDGAIVAGSWGLALAWGTLLSSILIGASWPLAILPAAAVAALFAMHGLAFASLRLTGELRARARVLSPGAEWHTYLLTAGVLTAVGILAGFRLPLEPVNAWLVPVILIIIPFLVASQAWVWWVFRHRVTGPSYL
ncbi:cytochrome d ubiquinol oxidase subunit II [Nonomuraea typhae]|uniref:cytochrome d ubiquinol oxidase subunit II n=1 Tax=Nonomuraea typhae TaxID=2603600 RepID=UPI0012F768CB|nr:cytochrome d ubiquinol oxidase subunit II [Nonomuraea typhae]